MWWRKKSLRYRSLAPHPHPDKGLSFPFYHPPPPSAPHPTNLFNKDSVMPLSLRHNSTGHSKFHNTSNHPPHATYSGRTARTPLYPPVQAPPPPPPPHFFPCPGTCARDRRALQQLTLNVHVKHSDLT